MGFVTKLASAGGLVYSTFLGGTRGGPTFTSALNVAYASSGQVYVSGLTESTQGFPGTGTLFPAPTVGFVTSLNPVNGGPVAWTYTYAAEITGLALGPGSGPGGIAYLSTGLWITGFDFGGSKATSPPWSSTDAFAERMTDPVSIPSGPIVHF
jgi:hypothetical protein